MGAPHLAAAHPHRGGQNLLRGQGVDQQTHGGDVRHRVQGPHLVEVNVLHWYAMDPTLRLGNAVIHRQNIPPHRLRQLQMVLHQVADVMEIPVLMAMPMVVMAVGVLLPFLLTRHGDCQMRAGDAAFHAFLQGKAHPGQPQTTKRLHKRRRVRQQLQQGRRQHVPRRTHAAVQIQCLHRFASM